ncbi:MAG: hypothetical protein QW552_05295 [Ignisphaera sp.]
MKTETLRLTDEYQHGASSQLLKVVMHIVKRSNPGVCTSRVSLKQ